MQVFIGDKELFRDFGVTYISHDISPAEPQLSSVAIPGRNGSLDTSTVLTGDIRYNDRTIIIRGMLLGQGWAEYPDIQSTIENYLSKGRMDIKFGDDLNWFWEGKLALTQFDKETGYVDIEITAVVDPYKYVEQGDWLWDPFDFETGIINEGVIGIGKTEASYDLITLDMCTVGEVVLSVPAHLTITESGNEVLSEDLPSGTSKLYDAILEPNKTYKFVFTASEDGTAEIINRGGSL